MNIPKQGPGIIQRPNFNRPTQLPSYARRDRWQNRTDHLHDRGQNRTDRRNYLVNSGRSVRNNYRRSSFRNTNLNFNFWQGHRHPHYRYPARGWNPWRVATWGSVAGWVGYTGITAIPYDYGAGGNVIYEGDTVYVGDTSYSVEQYAQQAQEIATAVPTDVEVDDIEWMPLGVFALMQEGDESSDPTLYIQLAVSKEGILSGYFEDTSSGSYQPLEGSVDKKTQRAAWTIVGKDTPVMETGLDNLVQDETYVLIHFKDGQTQRWVMVRLPDPETP